jgi:hypothetical protein
MRRRFQKYLFIICCSGAYLSGAIIIFNVFFTIHYSFNCKMNGVMFGSYEVTLAGGFLRLVVFPRPIPSTSSGLRIVAAQHPIRYWPILWVQDFPNRAGAVFTSYHMSLVAPFTLFTMASWGFGFSLSRLRRERPKHACQICGYDLTGNFSGICPECGTTIVDKLESAESKVREQRKQT